MQRKRIFKACLVLFAAYKPCIFDNYGHRNDHPHWFELAKAPWTQVYKNTGTPCSCLLCQGERYNRKDLKKQTRRIIRESLM